MRARKWLDGARGPTSGMCSSLKTTHSGKSRPWAVDEAAAITRGENELERSRGQSNKNVGYSDLGVFRFESTASDLQLTLSRVYRFQITNNITCQQIPGELIQECLSLGHKYFRWSSISLPSRISVAHIRRGCLQINLDQSQIKICPTVPSDFISKD